jgi:hypothetical protein
MGLEHADPAGDIVQPGEQFVGHGCVHPQLAVAHRAQQVFPGMDQVDQRRQIEQARRALDRMDRAEQRIDRLAIVGIGFQRQQRGIGLLYQGEAFLDKAGGQFRRFAAGQRAVHPRGHAGGWLRCDFRACHTCHELDGCHEANRIDRLGEIEVGAGLIGAGNILGALLGAEHHGRDRLEIRVAAHLRKEGIAIHLLHVDVDHEQVEAVLQGLLQPFQAIDRLVHAKALAFEQLRAEQPHGQRVIHDQHAARRGFTRRRRGWRGGKGMGRQAHGSGL